MLKWTQKVLNGLKNAQTGLETGPEILKLAQEFSNWPRNTQRGSESVKWLKNVQMGSESGPEMLKRG